MSEEKKKRDGPNGKEGTMIEKDAILLKEDAGGDWSVEPDPAGVRPGFRVAWDNTGGHPVQVRDPAARLFLENEVVIAAGARGEMTVRDDVTPGESYAYEVFCPDTSRSTPPIMIIDRDGGHG